VVVVHDGREALAAVPRFNPEFVLLDIGMPGLNGYEVAQKIREAAPASPIKLIAVTGWGHTATRLAPVPQALIITSRSRSSPIG